MTKQAVVSKLPKCDFCSDPAKYDAKTRMGYWASMCAAHYIRYGVGLGIGKGQELILAKSSQREEPKRSPHVTDPVHRVGEWSSTEEQQKEL